MNNDRVFASCTSATHSAAIHLHTQSVLLEKQANTIQRMVKKLDRKSKVRIGIIKPHFQLSQTSEDVASDYLLLGKRFLHI